MHKMTKHLTSKMYVQLVKAPIKLINNHKDFNWL